MAHDSISKADFDRYRMYWRIRNSRLEAWPVTINLQRGEICHFSCPVKWLEQEGSKPTYEGGHRSHGFQLHYTRDFEPSRLGTYSLPNHEYKYAGHGTAYLTNRRVIFTSSTFNRQAVLSEMLAITPYLNGIDLKVTTGNSPFLNFDQNVDLFAMTLNRLMAEQ